MCIIDVVLKKCQFLFFHELTDRPVCTISETEASCSSISLNIIPISLAGSMKQHLVIIEQNNDIDNCKSPRTLVTD